MISEEMRAKLLRYGVISSDDADGAQTMTECAQAAEEYLAGADVPATPSPLRDMAIQRLALYWFDCRSADAKAGYPPPPPDVNALVNSLRYGRKAAEGEAAP